MLSAAPATATRQVRLEWQRHLRKKQRAEQLIYNAFQKEEKKRLMLMVRYKEAAIRLLQRVARGYEGRKVYVAPDAAVAARRTCSRNQVCAQPHVCGRAACESSNTNRCWCRKPRASKPSFEGARRGGW